MAKQKPLFIYDCDGTLQTLVARAWAMAKKENKTDLSLAEFRAQHPGETAMLPGMANVVRYTDSLGDNVLVSDGNPGEEGCPELQELRVENRFKGWKYKGREVKWGQSPDHMSKVERSVAEELLKNFLPSKIVVIGDTLDDYILALHIAHFVNSIELPDKTFQRPQVIAFIKRGVPTESCENAQVPVFAVDSGQEMQQLIQNLIEEPNSKTKSLSARLKAAQQDSQKLHLPRKSHSGK